MLLLSFFFHRFFSFIHSFTSITKISVTLNEVNLVKIFFSCGVIHKGNFLTSNNISLLDVRKLSSWMTPHLKNFFTRFTSFNVTLILVIEVLFHYSHIVFFFHHIFFLHISRRQGITYFFKNLFIDTHMYIKLFIFLYLHFVSKMYLTHPQVQKYVSHFKFEHNLEVGLVQNHTKFNLRLSSLFVFMGSRNWTK